MHAEHMITAEEAEEYGIPSDCFVTIEACITGVLESCEGGATVGEAFDAVEGCLMEHFSEECH